MDAQLPVLGDAGRYPAKQVVNEAKVITQELFVALRCAVAYCGLGSQPLEL